MTTKAIAFDFDGVFVLDSDAVFKKEAWRQVLAHHGEFVEHLAEGNRLYGSGKPGGRVEILHHIFERLGKPAGEIDGLVAKAAQEFDDYVQAEILRVGLVPGAMKLLQDLSARGVASYLNSGTATSALERSARNLEIDTYLKAALGSTHSKVDNLRFVAKNEGATPEEILVVGDGDSDKKAADEFGARFVGVTNKWNNWTSDEGFPIVADLRDVVHFL